MQDSVKIGKAAVHCTYTVRDWGAAADSRWLVQRERFCRYVLRAAYTNSTFHMSLGLSPGCRSSTIFWNRDRGCFEISSLLRNFVRCR